MNDAALRGFRPSKKTCEKLAKAIDARAYVSGCPFRHSSAFSAVVWIRNGCKVAVGFPSMLATATGANAAEAYAKLQAKLEARDIFSEAL